MKRLLTGWLLVLLWPALAWCQEVPLRVDGGGAKVVQVDRQIIVRVDVLTVSAFPFTVNATPGEGIFFWTIPPGVTAIDQGDRLEVKAAPKGEHTFAVKVISADWANKKFATRFGQLTVVVGDAGGIIPPVPIPPVPIPPVPVPLAKAWVVVIEETADATAKRQAYFADAALNEFLKTKGWKHRIADKDVVAPDGKPPADLAPFLKIASGRPLPYLFVVAADGNVPFHGALPATPAELLALLKKLGG